MSLMTRPTPERAPGNEAQWHRGSVGDPGRPRQTILVVDDDPDVRRLTGRVLDRLGFRLFVAADGQDAFEIYRARGTEIDLILSDMAMPRMSGGELYRAVRDGGDREVKFLMMSGNPSRGQGGWDQLDPGVPFLAKPWTLDELREQLQALLPTAVPRASGRADG